MYFIKVLGELKEMNDIEKRVEEIKNQLNELDDNAKDCREKAFEVSKELDNIIEEYVGHSK